jgi:hypothetical protein
MSRLYAFDLDDNIVTTDSIIQTLAGPLSTKAYAENRGNAKLAKNAFTDLDDVDNCKLEKAPSFPIFEKALKEGFPVAIITARGNDKESLLRLLSRAAALGHTELHANVHIYCCNSEEYEKEFNAETKTLEERKCLALENFLQLYPMAKKIGFSDDDVSNLKCMRVLFQKLQDEKPALKCSLFLTDDSKVTRMML